MRQINNSLIMTVFALAGALMLQAAEGKTLTTRDVTQMIAQYAPAAQKKPAIRQKAATPAVTAAENVVATKTPTGGTTGGGTTGVVSTPPKGERIGDLGVDSGKVVEVGFDEEKPLILRYTIHRQVDGADTEEVASDTVFRSGERFRFKVDANENGYLYIVNKSPNGQWNLLFPSKAIAGGLNRVEADYHYPVPPEDPKTGEAHWFEFDEETGEETVYLVLSRKPVDELDGLIYGQPRPARTPAGGPGIRPAETMTLAKNLAPGFGDRFEQVRGDIIRTRGIFNTADGKNAGMGPASDAKAVYVVDLQNDPDSRLVVELKLKHE